MNLLKITTKISFFCCSVSGLFLDRYIDWRSKTNDFYKLNLVFDLDNTLMSSEKISRYNQFNNKLINKYDFKTNFINTKDEDQYYVWIRPHAKLFLGVISKFTNVYVFTAAKEKYANNIVDELFTKKPINIYHYDNYKLLHKKDLKIIAIDLNKTYLIDDKISNKVDNQNFYHIPQYHYHNKNDNEILKLFIWILKKDLLYIKNNLDK